MKRAVQQEVIQAYDRRGKGRSDAPFVDRTRNGAYLEIDKAAGSVRQISRDEYHSSRHEQLDDGLPGREEEVCNECNRFSCTCD
jgi:hypothetical protein